MKNLIEKALSMRILARATYSNYSVGAAVKSKDGSIIGGCNIENASYGLSICAERTALFRAIAENHKDFEVMVIATENGGTPCGACRQVIWELCGDIPIITIDANGKQQEFSSKELLPGAFGPEKLL